MNYKKINVYINGVYIFSTNKFERCKDAVNDIKSRKSILVHSIPKNEIIYIKDSDKVTARFTTN